VKRSKPIADFPSEISTDEWGEINRYSKIIDQEEKEKAKKEQQEK
jgi:hypothetical protein